MVFSEAHLDQTLSLSLCSWSLGFDACAHRPRDSQAAQAADEGGGEGKGQGPSPAGQPRRQAGEPIRQHSPLATDLRSIQCLREPVRRQNDTRCVALTDNRIPLLLKSFHSYSEMAAHARMPRHGQRRCLTWNSLHVGRHGCLDNMVVFLWLRSKVELEANKKT